MNKNTSFTDSMTVDARLLPKHRCRSSLRLSSFLMFFKVFTENIVNIGSH
ncbi:hypothetical protein [Prevotella vespertina]|nr:hypothetical protein [Prevotella vespertina]